MIRMKDYEILEVTLRDGSYAINYSFTAEDTKNICLQLEEAGFRLIEIGHGEGINARNPPRNAKPAICTDEEYLAAASSVLKKAKFGMFLLPRVATKEAIKMAWDYGMGFIRVGTNAPEYNEALTWIKYCKEYGFFTSYNAMKSYVMKPQKIADIAKKAEKAGADLIQIVDSSGGMFPQQIKDYISTVKKCVGVEVGFHAHNNLQMAVINSIVALEAGATIIDVSLRGMGRSAGNAQTEILLYALKKLGYPVKYDIYKAMEIGDRLIKPKMMESKGTDYLDVIMGYADMTSPSYKYIHKIAKEFKLDERDLIIEAANINKVTTTEEVVRKAADIIISRIKDIQ